MKGRVLSRRLGGDGPTRRSPGGPMRRVIRVILLAGLGCLTVSCKSPQDVQMPPEAIESLGRYEKEYLIAPMDQLEIVVVRNQELSRTVVVRPDGYISVPIVDDVKAAGLTIPELDAELTRLYSTRLVDPEITVIGTSLRQPMIYVYGEVGAPKAIPLRDARTAAQAIASAGGYLPSASKDSVALVRMTEDGHLQALRLSPKTDGEAGRYMTLQTVALEADDLIVVPERPIVQFDRWLNEFVITPGSAVNSVLIPYLQIRLIQAIESSN